jgi:hypothetical protein
MARLVLAPFVFADPQAPTAGPIAASAARQAEAPPPPSPRHEDRGPMHTGLKWTGIGMVLGSTGGAVSTLIGDCLDSRHACRMKRTRTYAASGALAVTGVVLLAIADAKSGPPPDDTPIQAAATRAAEAAAADADRPSPGRFRPAPFWTGVGLVSGSGFHYLLASKNRRCETDACRTRRRIGYGSAIAMAGTGIVLMGVGARGESPVPTLEVGEGRAAIVQRIRF